MRAARVQASLRIRAVSPEPSLLAHTSSESRGTFRQKARSLAPLNGWTCAVEICHDGMLEDTNSLDGAHLSCSQVAYFTALFPYAMLLTLLIRGVTLKGAAEGIKYYLRPDFSRLASAQVSRVSFCVHNLASQMRLYHWVLKD